MLVDNNLHVGFSVLLNLHQGVSCLGLCNCTARHWDVDGITLLALVRQLAHEVSHNKILLVCGDNLIAPDFRNEGCCGGGGDVV